MSTIQNDAINRVSSDSVSAKNAIKGKTAEDMGMNEFFSLLTAQMTNQDMMNPESNTEFIAQMAQFSALKGVQTIQENQLASYAVSYSGKEVTIAQVNKTGELETIKGVVEKVTFFDGQPQVVVNGTKYPMHQIMEITHDVKANNEQSAGNSLSMVAGHIGKIATVTDTSDPANPQEIKGEVVSVTLKGGKPYVTLDNGKEYAYTAISEISDRWYHLRPNPDVENETGDGDEVGGGEEVGGGDEVGGGEGVGDGDGTDTVTPNETDNDDETGTNPDPEE